MGQPSDTTRHWHRLLRKRARTSPRPDASGDSAEATTDRRRDAEQRNSEERLNPCNRTICGGLPTTPAPADLAHRQTCASNLISYPDQASDVFLYLLYAPQRVNRAYTYIAAR